MLAGSPTFFDDTARAAGEEQFCALLTVTGDQLAEPLRLVCDVAPLVSRGFTFIALPFGWKKPAEGEAFSAGQLVFSNIAKEMGEVILAAKGPLNGTLEDVLRSEPDTVIRDCRNLLLTNAVMTGTDVSVQIEIQQFPNAAWPGTRATPAITPGLHR